MKILRITGGLLGLLLVVITVKGLTFAPPERGEVIAAERPAVEAEEAARRLAGALAYKTISHMDTAAIDKQAFFDFHSYLAQSFPRVHQVLQREVINELSLLYRWQGSDDSLKPAMLLGHLDVVPVLPQSRSEWQHPPFGGRVVDQVIWGRGAVDIKSGVMASLEAIEAMLAKGRQPKRTLYLAFGHDEEIGGLQGAKRIAGELERRGLQFDFILDEGGTIVHQGVIPGIDSQVALVGVAEKGYVSLELATSATGGHSSMPPKHTAVGVISRAITRLEDNPFPVNMDYARALFGNIGPKMNGLNKWVFANMWLTEPLVAGILGDSNTTNATIRTTTAATMISGSDKDNVLPDRATAVVNFRIMPGETIASVIEHVNRVIDDERVSITPVGDGVDPSPASPSDNGHFSLLARTIHQVADDPELVVTPYLVVGGTDAKHYTNLSPNVYRFVFNRFTPTQLDQMHGVNEQVRVSDYLDLVTFYHQLILNLDEA